MSSPSLRIDEAAREVGLAPPPPLKVRWNQMRRIFGSYWLSSDWKFAWLGLAVLIVYQFGVNYILVQGNLWQKNFFDAMEQRQLANFVPLLITFLIIALSQVLIEPINSYFSETLGIRWRRELTNRYLGRWMARDRYAEIERLRLIDNPDQRISEDIHAITGPMGLLDITFGMLGMVVGAISFGAILMATAAPIEFSLFGRSVSIPGSTVWYAIIYALAGSYLISKIGAPFVRATMRQQHREANFRASLIHVRRNAAQIGFMGAVETEKTELSRSFGGVFRNYRSVIFSAIGINIGQGIYERIGSILPLLIMVPRYFAGAMSFGDVMSGRDAFGQMVGRLSFFVQIYSRIGMQIACLNRLQALDDAMDLERPRGIGFAANAQGDVMIQTKGLEIWRPNGAPLMGVGDWTIQSGARWVVRGPSGAGKSTLLRAIVGLWPEGTGQIAINSEKFAMVVPQRLYLPVGTLKNAICFPDKGNMHPDEQILALLDKVGLAAHREHLHDARIWQEELSPGEQQRVALARILLHRPELLILDEATSALDPDNARSFHAEILAMRPDLTLISVIHDETLMHYHTHQLVVVDGIATCGPIEENA